MSQQTDPPFAKSNKETDSIAHAVAELEKSHREELQRLHLCYAERIRQVETERLRAERQIEILEDNYAELLEKYQIEIKKLFNQLIVIRNGMQESVEDVTEKIREQVGQMQKQRSLLEAELNTLAFPMQGEILDTTREILQLLNSRHKEKSQENKNLSEQLNSANQEVERYRSALAKAESHIEALRESASFRLGNTLIDHSKSFKGLLSLPFNLLDIYRDIKQRRIACESAKSVVVPGEKPEHMLAELKSIYTAQGLNKAESFARKQCVQPKELAGALTQLARMELRVNPGAAMRLAREAVQLDPRPFRQKWLAFRLFDAGHINEAYELLLSMPENQKLNPSERYKIDYITGCHRLLSNGPEIPYVLNAPAYKPVPKRVLYVVSSSLPYHVTGYTMRTHSIVKAIKDRGWDISVVTRPGYPGDRADSGQPANSSMQIIDGIHYRVLTGPHRRKVPLDHYFTESAQIIAAMAKEQCPAIIHAASNYEAAIPALIAARTLGIPFVYEVRGLWEYTSASKIPGWEQTERFALDRRLESIAATSADQLFTLTGALAGELKLRGVCASKILLVPNAIDPEKFTPASRDKQLAASLGIEDTAFVVGYLGSVVVYEGLDDLVSAFQQFVVQHPDAKLVIVGDGDYLPVLRSQAQALALDDKVIFTGKVPPADVPRYFTLFNAVALPRKPFKVCRLVSPLKPLEVMSMGVPLVVSDVDALKEMVQDGETALVHSAGDAASLARCLLRLAREPELADKLARAARQEVIANRTWKQVAETVSSSYHALIDR